MKKKRVIICGKDWTDFCKSVDDIPKAQPHPDIASRDSSGRLKFKDGLFEKMPIGNLSDENVETDGLWDNIHEVGK